MDWPWFSSQWHFNWPCPWSHKSNHLEKNSLNTEKCCFRCGQDRTIWHSPRQSGQLLLPQCHLSIGRKRFQNQKHFPFPRNESTRNLHGQSHVSRRSSWSRCGWLHSSQLQKSTCLCQAQRRKINLGHDSLKVLCQVAQKLWRNHWRLAELSVACFFGCSNFLQICSKGCRKIKGSLEWNPLNRKERRRYLLWNKRRRLNRKDGSC